MCQNYIAYYRVSTNKQGIAGLGMEAQQKAVEAYIASKGADGRLIASYKEVESGKNDKRPQLEEAINRAAVTKSVLVIAKLDRLSRSVFFLKSLEQAGIEFVCCDMPFANKMTINLIAMLAEWEREQISARTKAALSVLKERGVKLGNSKGCDAVGVGNDAANNIRKEKADAYAARVMKEVRRYQADGVVGATDIARKLNENSIFTRRGNQWSTKTVIDLLNRSV